MSGKRHAWYMAALGLAAVVPYLSSLNYQFVYDDHGVIVENDFLENPGNIVAVLTLRTMADPGVVDGQRPVVVASYFFDRWIWGINPTGFRLTNLALHAVNVLLVFGLFDRLFPSLRCGRTAWLTAMALMFAWHPLAVEPVQSPSFREDLLCLMGGLIFLRMGWDSASPTKWVAGVTAFALSLLSKESAILFPALLAAGWWLLPETRPARRWIIRWLIPVAAITLMFGWMVYGRGPVQSLGGEWNGWSLRGVERLWSPPWLAFEFQQKILLPFSLSVDYRVNPVTSAADPRFAAGLFFVLFEVVLILFARRRWPVFSLGLAWMLIAFMPVSNLMPLFNPAADRYAYAALPGFVIAFGALVNGLRMRGWAVMAIALGGYLALTIRRLPDWKDDRTLWESALNVEPRSARAHTWLGLLEYAEGNVETAWRHYEMAEKLNPHDVSPAVNRAIILGEHGRLDEAEHLLRDVLSRRPNHKEAARNLEICLRLQGKEPDR